MKYALYARKSSEESAKRQIQSIDNQIQVLKEKAKKENLNIVKVYQESKSAKKPYKRIEFNQMMADLQDGIIDSIICWDLTRLSRNPIEGGQIQFHLQEGTIKEIITYDRTYHPSDNSIMMNLELGMATEYSLALGKNVKRGQGYKVQKGHYPNTAPLGYRNTTHELTKGERVIKVDDETFPMVRKLWDILLKDELSVYQLTKKAEMMGLKTKTGKKLSRHGLYKILTNPFYHGQFQWSGELYQGKHKPMIRKDEFEEAQRILTKNKQVPRPKKHFYALKGHIYCGECGASITAEHKDKKRKDGSVNHRVYYRCTRRKKDCDCKQTSIREEDLDKQFSEIMESITIPEAFVQWCAKWLQDQSEEDTIKRKSLRKQQEKSLNKLDDQIQKLLNLRLNEEIDSDTFKAKNESLLAEKRSIESEMRLNNDSQEDRIQKTVSVFEFCKNVKTNFDNGTPEDKKEILQLLGSVFYLKDQKLSVEFAKPFKLVQNAVSEKWVLNPRFATLKSKSEHGLSSSDRMLYLNGGDEGTRTLDPLRDRQVL